MQIELLGHPSFMFLNAETEKSVYYIKERTATTVLSKPYNHKNTLWGVFYYVIILLRCLMTYGIYKNIFAYYVM